MATSYVGSPGLTLTGGLSDGLDVRVAAGVDDGVDVTSVPAWDDGRRGAAGKDQCEQQSRSFNARHLAKRTQSVTAGFRGSQISGTTRAAAAHQLQNSQPDRRRNQMPKFMDVHHGMHGVTPEALQAAHQADLDIQGEEDVDFQRAWGDPESGMVWCISEAPNADAVKRIHERTGHPATEVYPVPVEV